MKGLLRVPLVAAGTTGLILGLSACTRTTPASAPPTTALTVVVNGKSMTVQQMSDALSQAIGDVFQMQTTIGQMQRQLSGLHTWAQCVDANLASVSGVREYCGTSEP